MPTEAPIDRITSLTQCTATLHRSPADRIRGFNPLLACYDLTRTAPLPASDGCPTSTSAIYDYHGHADIKEIALYIQDTITLKNWTFNLGLRGDHLPRHHQRQPSGARARHRLQYQANQHRAALLLRPHARNAVQRESGAVQPGLQRPGGQALMSVTQGFPCLTVPLSPGTRNEFHAGLAAGFGKYLVVDGEYIWKYTQQGLRFQRAGQHADHFPDRVGPVRRFPATRCAPPCRISTASRRSW